MGFSFGAGGGRWGGGHRHGHGHGHGFFGFSFSNRGGGWGSRQRETAEERAERHKAEQAKQEAEFRAEFGEAQKDLNWVAQRHPNDGLGQFASQVADKGRDLNQMKLAANLAGYAHDCPNDKGYKNLLIQTIYQTGGDLRKMKEIDNVIGGAQKFPEKTRGKVIAEGLEPLIGKWNGQAQLRERAADRDSGPYQYGESSKETPVPPAQLRRDNPDEIELMEPGGTPSPAPLPTPSATPTPPPSEDTLYHRHAELFNKLIDGDKGGARNDKAALIELANKFVPEGSEREGLIASLGKLSDNTFLTSEHSKAIIGAALQNNEEGLANLLKGSVEHMRGEGLNSNKDVSGSIDPTLIAIINQARSQAVGG